MFQILQRYFQKHGLLGGVLFFFRPEQVLTPNSEVFYLKPVCFTFSYLVLAEYLAIISYITP